MCVSFIKLPVSLTCSAVQWPLPIHWDWPSWRLQYLWPWGTKITPSPHNVCFMQHLDDIIMMHAYCDMICFLPVGGIMERTVATTIQCLILTSPPSQRTLTYVSDTQWLLSLPPLLTFCPSLTQMALIPSTWMFVKVVFLMESSSETVTLWMSFWATMLCSIELLEVSTSWLSILNNIMYLTSIQLFASWWWCYSWSLIQMAANVCTFSLCTISIIIASVPPVMSEAIWLLWLGPYHLS